MSVLLSVARFYLQIAVDQKQEGCEHRGGFHRVAVRVYNFFYLQHLILFTTFYAPSLTVSSSNLARFDKFGITSYLEIIFTDFLDKIQAFLNKFHTFDGMALKFDKLSII